MLSDFDPCPWHLKTKPTGEVSLVGNRDDPHVLITIKCPVCDVSRHYCPTEKEVEAHYANRYSDNKAMIVALASKLKRVWNWRKK